MGGVTKIAFAFFCVLCYSTSSLAFIFEDCDSTLGKFAEVSVSECHTSDEVCTLVPGTNVSISFKFTPNTDISQVNARVYGVLVDVPILFPIDRPNACKDPEDGIDCPLHKDQEYHYTTTIFVPKNIPDVNVDIKWELVNDKDNKIVCIMFPAKIK